jgi:hypothetical protein
MSRLLSILLLLTCGIFAQLPSGPVPHEDAIRVREFYRLAAQIQDQIWPNWSQIPAPLLLLTTDNEFLTHHPAPPKDFTPAEEGFYSRPRQFPTNLLATFPAFGPPAVIVIGEPQNTGSKASTPWLITLMHEHFHQLQDSQPGYFQAVEALALSRGDTSGMWMLNYPFPYEKLEIVQSFARLRDLLLAALGESDKNKFENLANQYVQQRRHFFAQLSSDDKKYFNFQLWQEGIARYTQIKVAEAAARYQPSAEYAALRDFEPFATQAANAMADTISELRHADLGKSKRTVVYSFGAAEGLLLDRLNPNWKAAYFRQPFTLDPLFPNY